MMTLTRSDLLLRLAHEIGDLMNRATSLVEMLQDVADRIAESLHFDVVSIYLFDDATGDLVLRATHGLTVDPEHPVRLRPDEGLTGMVYTDQQTITAMPASQHPHFKHIPGIGEESYEGFLGVPLRLQHRCLGVLVGQTQRQRAINPAEEMLFEIIAGRLSGLLEVANRFERMAPEEPEAQAETQAFQGKGLTHGFAVGRVHVMRGLLERARQIGSRAVSIEGEVGRLHAALGEAEAELRRTVEQVREDDMLPASELTILEAHISFLTDGAFRGAIEERIREERVSAEIATMEAVEAIALPFERRSEPYLRERGQDFRDLGERILSHLMPCAPDDTDCQEPDEGAVLVAHDIGPSALLALHRRRIAALVTEQGGETSHTAILAKSLGIPAVAGVENATTVLGPGERALVDGRTGFVFTRPHQQLVAEYEENYQRLDEFMALAAKEEETDAPLSIDMDITAAIGFPVDVDLALKHRLRDVGLFRTEFYYMLHEQWPSVEAQTRIYQEMAESLSGSITTRTLDIGGDKRLPYLPFPREDNPLLGLRSIRYSMEHLDYFRDQMRAILLAHAQTPRFRILLPMVTDLWEVESAREIVTDLAREIEMRSEDVPPLGMMIEVPAVLHQLADYCGLIDFVSIGLNDLTQYLLAVDRASSIVGHLYSGLHPAVLRVLDRLQQDVSEIYDDVSVCGELAASPAGALALMALGYRQFGILPVRAPVVRYLARRLDPGRLSDMRQVLLSLRKQHEVARYLRETLAGIDPLLLEVP